MSEFNPQKYSAKFSSTQIHSVILKTTTFSDLQEIVKQP